MKNKKQENYDREISIFVRYITLAVLIFVFQTDIFITFITNIFNFFAYHFLNLFSSTILDNGVLYINNEHIFLIVKECIASSAYIFIATILLTLPIKLKLNFNILWKALVVFSIVNLIRILFLMWIHLTFGEAIFNDVHLIFYEGVSGILVAVIIIFFLRKNKIRKLYPVFSDMTYLISLYKKK